MPKFMILCSSVKSYSLIVEAPSKEAAEKYYEEYSDGDEFTENSEGGWELDDIQPVSVDCKMAMKVGLDGSPV